MSLVSVRPRRFLQLHRLELSLFISLLFVFFQSFLADSFTGWWDVCTFPCMQDSPFYLLLLCMYPSRCAPSLLRSLPVVCVFVWPKNISPNSELLEKTVPSFLFISLCYSFFSFVYMSYGASACIPRSINSLRPAVLEKSGWEHCRAWKASLTITILHYIIIVELSRKTDNSSSYILVLSTFRNDIILTVVLDHFFAVRT